MQIDASDWLLAGTLSMHRPEVGPLVHHPTVGKPADAVLAARALANLALAAALGAKYRRRIRKRPSALRADDQHGHEDQPDGSPHLVLPVRVYLRHSITRARSVACKYVEPLKPRTRPIKTLRSGTRLLPAITNAGKA